MKPETAATFIRDLQRCNSRENLVRTLNKNIEALLSQALPDFAFGDALRDAARRRLDTFYDALESAGRTWEALDPVASYRVYVLRALVSRPDDINPTMWLQDIRHYLTDLRPVPGIMADPAFVSGVVEKRRLQVIMEILSRSGSPYLIYCLDAVLPSGLPAASKGFLDLPPAKTAKALERNLLHGLGHALAQSVSGGEIPSSFLPLLVHGMKVSPAKKPPSIPFGDLFAEAFALAVVGDLSMSRRKLFGSSDYPWVRKYFDFLIEVNSDPPSLRSKPSDMLWVPSDVRAMWAILRQQPAGDTDPRASRQAPKTKRPAARPVPAGEPATPPSAEPLAASGGDGDLVQGDQDIVVSDTLTPPSAPNLSTPKEGFTQTIARAPAQDQRWMWRIINRIRRGPSQ